MIVVANTEINIGNEYSLHGWTSQYPKLQGFAMFPISGSSFDIPNAYDSYILN